MSDRREERHPITVRVTPAQAAALAGLLATVVDDDVLPAAYRSLRSLLRRVGVACRAIAKRPPRRAGRKASWLAEQVAGVLDELRDVVAQTRRRFGDADEVLREVDQALQLVDQVEACVAKRASSRARCPSA
jgi:hypothetical protein